MFLSDGYMAKISCNAETQLGTTGPKSANERPWAHTSNFLENAHFDASPF